MTFTSCIYIFYCVKLSIHVLAPREMELTIIMHFMFLGQKGFGAVAHLCTRFSHF